MSQLPSPVERAIAAANHGDTDAFLATFTADGVVDDWGMSLSGARQSEAGAIASSSGSKSLQRSPQFRAPMGAISVHADVGGNGFNGPSMFTFLVAGDAVARMTIRGSVANTCGARPGRRDALVHCGFTATSIGRRVARRFGAPFSLREGVITPRGGIDSLIGHRFEGGAAMAQHGQVLKLRTRRPDGKAVWAYRYRVNGRCSKRPQVGGFATRVEAPRALQRTLERLCPGAVITLAELVEEYLEVHQAAPATIEKLRWLLAKATSAFGEVRLLDLRAEEICAWRVTLPEGHRFEATQALRQVLNRAVAWQLIDTNPARRGVSNPLRRFPEKRPFESWAEIKAVAECLGAVGGPMVVFAAATGLRPAQLVTLELRGRPGGRRGVRAAPVRARAGQAHKDTAERATGAAPFSRA
jgi:hypothetical protein